MNLKAVWGISCLVLSGACAADVGEEGEDFVTIQEEIVIGNWAGPFTNGNAGNNPMTWTQTDLNSVVICQVFESGDGRWHPGKLWGGQCRYDYGGSIKYAGTYHTLQKPASWSWVSNPGFTPSKAIGSSGSTSNSLPVCSAWGGTGKVWSGTCRFEHGGSRYQTSTFNFLVVP